MNARDRRFWAALEPLLIKVIQEKRRMLRARCKFVCDGVTHREGGKKSITLATRYDPSIAEDQKFSKLTPWGKMEFGLDNPTLERFFTPGKEYYITISEALPEGGEAPE